MRKAYDHKHYRKRSLKKLKKDKAKLHKEAERYRGYFKSSEKKYQDQMRKNIELELRNNKIQK